MKKMTIAVLIALAVLAVGQPASAVLIGADRVLGIVVPGVPANPNNEYAMVNGLLEGWGATLGYNDGAASGSVLGNNPADPGAEIYTLKYSPTTVIPVAPAPLATLAGYNNVSTGNAVINLGSTTYDWVLAKWGPDSAAYWIGGLSGEITLTRDGTGYAARGHGLSGYTLFNPRTQVPDGGTSAILLGIGLFGVGLLKRRLA